ncbi:cytochrome c3 family protein [Salmonella enterica]
MKVLTLITSLLCLLYSFSVFSEDEKNTVSGSDSLVSESTANYALKSHHKKLNLPCTACHKEKDVSSYKPLATKDCLACHGSAEKVAKRTGFMDINHTNPHRSLHDGLDLDCYECHAEHKPSSNLCETCHDNTRDWFGATP